MIPKKHFLWAAIIVFLFSISAGVASASPFKVLTVMSYESDYPWCVDIKAGIEDALPEGTEIKFFYMDTKVNLEGGPQKAEEAYELFKSFNPDGVITADDNVQSMLVVPFLKDKVKTPVMFCGVNAEPEKYGYPASNVSGILERDHIAQTIALARKVDPDIKTIGCMAKDSPTGKSAMEVILKNADSYPVKIVDFKFPSTLAEAENMSKALSTQCDALLIIASLEGLKNADGKPVTEKVIVPIVTKTFNKLSMGIISNHVKNGALLSVVQSGNEQGSTAARMLLKAMEGTSVSEIPITRNQNGEVWLNLDTAEALGIAMDYSHIESSNWVIYKGELKRPSDL